jgi:hypothetical protein
MEFAIFLQTSAKNQELVVVPKEERNRVMLVVATVDVEENSGLTLRK